MSEKEVRLIDARKISNDIALYLAENSYLNSTALDALTMVFRWVGEAPTIDPESLRPKGKWIYHPKALWRGEDRWECSNCGTYYNWIWEDIYCPTCGAKMEG